MVQAKPKQKGNERKDGELAVLKKTFKNYDALRKAYDLTDEDTTSRAILQRMIDHLDLYAKIIIQILQPEEFHSLHECNYFDELEKATLFELYKKIIILNREILLAEIKNDDQTIIDTIINAHSELEEIRPSMLNIVSKLKNSWKDELKRENIRYFG